MFGISFGELLIVAVILVIAVGPKKMPTFIKAAVKTYRDFRQATRDLRAQSGIDEILQDEDLRSLQRPLYVPPKKAGQGKKSAMVRDAAERRRALSLIERVQEDPPEGVDLAEAARELEGQSPAEEPVS